MKNFIFIMLSMFLAPSVLLCGINEDIEQREHLDKQKEIYKQLERNKDKSILYYDVEKPKQLENKQTQCFNIETITENSITLLSKEEKQKIFKEYLNICNTLNDLKNLTNRLTALYIEKGYVTSKVYIKPQSISKGEIELFAVEGKVESILPNELYIENAFFNIKNKYLNLRDLETSIEIINRLPSNHAIMRLLPGKKVEYTTVYVENNITNRIYGSMGLNNFGSKKTGDLQGVLNINIDNLLGINDKLSIGLNSTENHFDDENSVGNTFKYSFPIGRLLSTLSYRRTTYEQLVPARVVDYKSDGSTNRYELNLNYKLFHDQKNSINLGSFLAHSRSKNYISDTLIETSSYNLTNVGGSVDYLHRNSDFFAYIALNFTQGVDWFGSYNPTDLNIKYFLYNIDVSLTKFFKDFQYSFTFHYQHTNDKLFSSNQISIGGPYSIRGYKKEGLNGNNGYYFKNEFSKTLGIKMLDYFEQTYFIAFDGGQIKKEEDTKGGRLLSNIIGVKLSKDSFNAKFYYASPMYKEDVSISNNFFGCNINYEF